MIITLNTTPNSLAPINKELWFRTSATASGATDFKYVFRPSVKVEPFATNSYTVLNTYKIPSRPDGTGLYSPHRILKSYIDYDFNNVNNGGWSDSSLALVRYRVNYGFEYNPELEWADTDNLSSFLGLTFSTPHDLELGDIITLSKDNKIVNSSYDGTCSVTQVVNNYQIKTDKAFGDAISSETGEIISLLRLTATSSEFDAYNGTRQYDERLTNFGNIYEIGSSSSKFMTSFPATTYKKVHSDDYETISLILGTTASNIMRVRTYDSNMVGVATYSYTLINSNYLRHEFGIGPMNIKSNYPTGMNGVTFYTANVEIGGVTASEVKGFKLVENCSIYDKVRVMFLNSVGGWDFFNFTLDSKKSTSIKRTEYNRILDFDYSIGDRGRTTLGLEVEESYTLNSDWITETESNWLSELLTSPEVYIIEGLNRFPIIVTDNKYEWKTALRDRVFNLVLNFKYAYNVNTQNQ